MTMRTLTVAGAILAIGPASAALAGSHTWDIIEVFSNSDGTIQFIELHEMAGTSKEVNLANKQVTSQSTGNAFTFPENLIPPTANKHLLLATQAFADLPGAPTPDYIIPANFFDTAGDTLTYHIYDSLTFSGGDLPQDCVNSYNDGSGAAPNSPTNYNGDTGSIDCSAPACPADISGDDNNVDVFDLFVLLNNWGTSGVGADLAAPNDVVDVFDLFALLGAWGPCP